MCIRDSSISKLEAEDADGLTAVANTAHWRVTCTEDPAISAYGSATLGAADPDDFTQFADVTEAQVIGWLEHWTEIEDRLSEQYAAKQVSTATSKTF